MDLVHILFYIYIASFCVICVFAFRKIKIHGKDRVSAMYCLVLLAVPSLPSPKPAGPQFADALQRIRIALVIQTLSLGAIWLLATLIVLRIKRGP